MNSNLSRLSAFFLSALLLLTASCEKEERLPEPTQENQAISDPNLFLSTAEVSEINLGGILYKFQYGSNNMIESVEESFSFEESEDDVTVLVDLHATYDLIYTNSRLSSMGVEADVTYSIIENGEKEVLLNESGAYTVAVQYNSKKLLSTLTETHEDNSTIQTKREYNSENKLIKESYFEDGTETQYLTYEWEGKNVKNDKLFLQEDADNGRKLGKLSAARKKQLLFQATRKASQANLMAEESTYADFDDKVNPLNVLSLFGFNNGIFISNNNPGSFTFSGSIGSSSATISHQYDSKGRLSKYTLTDPEAGPISVDLKYRN